MSMVFDFYESSLRDPSVGMFCWSFIRHLIGVAESFCLGFLLCFLFPPVSSCFLLIGLRFSLNQDCLCIYATHTESVAVPCNTGRGLMKAIKKDLLIKYLSWKYTWLIRN